MFDVLGVRWHQKKRTIPYPAAEPVLPDRFRGRPSINKLICSPDCNTCTEVCPTEAIHQGREGIVLDMGKCLFCGECASACRAKAITYTSDYRLATRTRETLVLKDGEAVLAAALEKESRRTFGRSLKLREVSAAGCNACEADVNILSTIVF